MGGAKASQNFYGGAGWMGGLKHPNTSMVGQEGWGGGLKHRNNSIVYK